MDTYDLSLRQELRVRDGGTVLCLQCLTDHNLLYCDRKL